MQVSFAVFRKQLPTVFTVKIFVEQISAPIFVQNCENWILATNYKNPAIRNRSNGTTIVSLIELWKQDKLDMIVCSKLALQIHQTFILFCD